MRRTESSTRQQLSTRSSCRGKRKNPRFEKFERPRGRRVNASEGLRVNQRTMMTTPTNDTRHHMNRHSHAHGRRITDTAA
ncbi:hypothetical protein X777_11308 [Ooceraea biroi]|uniref:Uncharacterized protein n=1 Tax=Ooceraea biroi TaxID=2015173 RepID=A0A026W2A4_OOCBI|nr:hypothetical protein X777_11308 [Ooceraea biroi]